MAKKLKIKEVTPFYEQSTTLIETLKEAVSHSFKTKNSNNVAGGVRLGLDNHLPYPYITSRAYLKNTLLQLDYTVNKAGTVSSAGEKLMSVWKNIQAVEDYIATDDPNSLPMNDANKVREIREAISPPDQTQVLWASTETLPLRLTQNVLMTSEGPIAVTPLSNGGFNILLKRVVKQRIERLKEKSGKTIPDKKKSDQLFSSPKTLVFEMGGSNTQNVGRLVYEGFTRPYVNNFPQDHQRIRKAKSLYEKGLQPKLSKQSLQIYKEFRDQYEAGKFGNLSNMAVREQEFSILHTMACAAIQEQLEHADYIKEFYYQFSKSEEFKPKYNTVFEQGAYEAELRNSDWAKNAADTLACYLMNASIQKTLDGKKLKEKIFRLEVDAKFTVEKEFEQAIWKNFVG